MVIVADELPFVVGVDTHRDRHTLALVRRVDGAVAATIEVAADAAGYRQAWAFVEAEAAAGCLWAIEGTGSYGAGLARFLSGRGARVVEVERPQRRSRRHGKSDQLDAVTAARTALAQPLLGSPRAGGQRDALRALMAARAGAVAARRDGLNQLRALVVCSPEPLRAQLRPLARQALLDYCSTLRRRPADHELAGVLLALRACARRVRYATREAAELEQEIHTLVCKLAPALLAEPGIGPISAAQILLAWSHPGRLRNEACFARLAGSAPVPASSGQTIRHRLDRGGDRQLNRALHTILLARRKHHPATIAYIQRRQHEGKTSREATRCLKRYLARHLYRLLENTTPTTT